MQKNNYTNITHTFHQNLGTAHPIWLLQGDRALSIRIANQISEHPNISEHMTFELGSSLEQFWRFIDCYPNKYRVCTFIINASAKLSSLLKIIEEPPSKTYIMIIANNLPKVLMSRIGYVYNVYPTTTQNNKKSIQELLQTKQNINLDIIEQHKDHEVEAIMNIINILSDDILNTYQQMNTANEDQVNYLYYAESQYNTLCNIISTYEYINDGKVDAVNGLKICLSMINIQN